VDLRLPGLPEICGEVGLLAGQVPRKSEADYARVVVNLLQRARALEVPGVRLRRLVFVGDTRMNDTTAFDNICRAGGWPGAAFIGTDATEPARVEVASTPGGQPLYLANRWAALQDFDCYLRDQGFSMDETTAVVVDLDKTAIGARGRNAHVIDQARVQAVEETVADLLGAAFKRSDFLAAYDRLKLAEFHPFTADNQDYLAYICLVLGSGLDELPRVVAEVQEGRLVSFRQFIDQIETRAGSLPPGLRAIHDEIYALVRSGDPTPFKAFRRTEYRITVQRMGCLDEAAPVEQLLAEEIVITQEVRAAALEWQRGGALLFGLSDKPDEASLPDAGLAAQGFQPIHRTTAHVVGS
jgi:hypothetical protein